MNRVGRHDSTRVDEGRKCCSILAMKKMKARTVVGRGWKGPLCDPGPELLLGGREGGQCEDIKRDEKKIAKPVAPVV